MASMMIESTNQMIDRWTSQINFGNLEIDVEKEIITIAGEIIAKTSFGVEDENAKEVFNKLRALQMTLFNTNRYVGVPFGKYFNVKKNQEAKKLGKEIDKLLLTIVEARKNSLKKNSQKDLLGLLLQENNNDGRLGKTLSSREVVDECKTFFFGGHETTALAITWTLMLLATHEDWQNQLREEIKEVVGNNELDITMLAGLKKVIKFLIYSIKFLAIIFLKNK
jgi:cytochrome P450